MRQCRFERCTLPYKSCTGIRAWQNRIDGLLDVISNYFDGAVDYVDVGSGMFGQMDPSLAIQFGDHVPTYDDYARVVAGTMAQFFSGSEKKPILFSEPVLPSYQSLYHWQPCG